MKIFISWSGDRSRAVAEALNDWLQRVIQAVEPFYTPVMEKGVKWSNEIDTALEGTRFGIVCLTPDNLKSTWIHYETGALSKTKDAVIWTFLHGLVPSDVPQPLGRFQHTLFEKADVLKLLQSVNSRLREIGGNALKDALLEEIFEESWVKLEAKLKDAEKLPVEKTESNKKTESKRDNNDLLNEILEFLRIQQRRSETYEYKVDELYSMLRPFSGSYSSKVRSVVKNKHDNLPLDGFLGISFSVPFEEKNRKSIFKQITEYGNDVMQLGFHYETLESDGKVFINVDYKDFVTQRQIDEIRNIAEKYFGKFFTDFGYITT